MKKKQENPINNDKDFPQWKWTISRYVIVDRQKKKKKKKKKNEKRDSNWPEIRTISLSSSPTRARKKRKEKKRKCFCCLVSPLLGADIDNKTILRLSTQGMRARRWFTCLLSTQGCIYTVQLDGRDTNSRGKKEISIQCIAKLSCHLEIVTKGKHIGIKPC